jgi:hypothetical protein
MVDRRNVLKSTATTEANDSLWVSRGEKVKDQEASLGFVLRDHSFSLFSQS